MSGIVKSARLDIYRSSCLGHFMRHFLFAYRVSYVRPFDKVHQNPAEYLGVKETNPGAS